MKWRRDGTYCIPDIVHALPMCEMSIVYAMAELGVQQPPGMELLVVVFVDIVATVAPFKREVKGGNCAGLRCCIRTKRGGSIRNSACVALAHSVSLSVVTEVLEVYSKLRVGLSLPVGKWDTRVRVRETHQPLNEHSDETRTQLFVFGAPQSRMRGRARRLKCACNLDARLHCNNPCE